jgi:hypothetical protein
LAIVAISLTMPIYEFYCERNHTVYQFYAKTLAQGKLVPKCPDNPRWPLKRVVSQFAFTGRAQEPKAGGDLPAGGDSAEDAHMEAAMSAMESEFASVDENDPKAMARMMRRMSELTGEKIDGEMEEVVRKLEEGVDPETLEDRFGGGEEEGGEDDPHGTGAGSGASDAGQEKKEERMRWKFRRATTPRRDPKLYDYE